MKQLFPLVSLLATLFIPASPAWSQRIATLKVDISRPMNGVAIPATADLDAITFLPDSALELRYVQPNDKTLPVPFQIDQDGRRTLHWMVAPQQGKTATFELVKKTRGAGIDRYDSIHAVADSGELTISYGDQLHPLWSPHGQVLTRIQAPDHYHHYGIWAPWTHVLYKGDTVDFWNLKDRKGTVRFSRLVSMVSGPVFAQYEALQEHVAFEKGGGEEVAMNEVQTVRVYRSPDNKDYYLFDLTIQLNCATPNPVRLLAYRYGGVGWRATADWNKDNSEVLTSEGKTRGEADGSKARWCIVQGTVGGDYAGAEMISYPGNYNYPEPLRVWPDNSNGRGDMYANFSPTKDIDWPLMPGHNYVLRYRWVVFNGHFSKDKAESASEYFSTPARVTVKKD